MQIPVLIEPVGGNGYRARAGEPFALTAEAATAEEAQQKLKEMIDARLAAGARLVNLEVAPAENPWLKLAGTLDPEDPMVKEWIAIMEENRRKANEDPDYL